MTRRFGSLASLGAGAGAVAWLCWEFGFDGLTNSFAHASIRGLTFYLLVSAAVVTTHSLRWQLVIRALGGAVPLSRLIRARLAGDAVGALVPSAKLAGEPVRIALLRTAGVAGAEAGAGVSLDRLLEVIGNMMCFILYLSVFSLTRVGSMHTTTAVIGVMLALLAVLTVPLMMLRRGVAPLAPLYGDRAQRWFRPLSPWMPALRDAESHVLRFFRDDVRTFAWGLLAALGSEALAVCQYWLLLTAFAIRLDLPTFLLTLVGSGFARSVPTPVGLGALELSQVGVLTLAAGRPDVGFIVGMVMRLHETLWIVVGFAALSGRGLSLARLRALAISKVAA